VFNACFRARQTTFFCDGQLWIASVEYLFKILIQMRKNQLPDHQIRQIEKICLFIKNWRLNERLSQEEFSKIAGIHANSVYNIERMQVPNLITLLNCIDAMDGMTLSEFFIEME